MAKLHGSGPQFCHSLHTFWIDLSLYLWVDCLDSQWFSLKSLKTSPFRVPVLALVILVVPEMGQKKQQPKTWKDRFMKYMLEKFNSNFLRLPDR